MKKLALAALSLIATLALSSVAFSHAKPKEKPSLLYQVTGKGLAKPSFIFGTFHAICAPDMVPLASLETYLTQADQLMMEIDMDDTVEMQSMGKSIFMADGKTLKDFLKPEELAKVDEMLRNYVGAPVDNLINIKPSMLTILALTRPKAMGCTPMSIDMDLMKSAVAKKKPVLGLETVASQVKVLDSMPLDKQAKGLYKMATDPAKAIAELKKLAEAYKTQDVEKLFDATTSQTTEDQEFQTRLLADRNTAWIPKLEVAFKEKPTFVAVGAGHLGGKQGVIKLLRKRGYKVKPVNLS